MSEVRKLQELTMADAAEALHQAQYAPAPELIERGIYKLRSRNLDYGVWTGQVFIGIREKIGSRYLDGEVLNYPPGNGTATPLEYRGMLREGIVTGERDNPELFFFLEELETR